MRTRSIKIKDRNIYSGNVSISSEIVSDFNNDLLDTLYVTDEGRGLIKEFSGIGLRKLMGRAIAQPPRYGEYNSKYYITPLEEDCDVD